MKWWLVLCFPMTCFAVSITQTPLSQTAMQLASYRKLPIAAQKQEAKVFGLTPKEYTQFLNLKATTYEGHTFPKTMNPNLLLAQMATNRKDKLHYIDQAVRQEHDTIASWLVVDKLWRIEAKRLYPNEKPFETPAMQAQARGLKPGDVVQVFCRINSPACSVVYSAIKMRLAVQKGVRLDLFFIGKKITNATIIDFARRLRIAPSIVAARRITLNNGNHLFAALEKERGKTLSLPYVVVRRNGHLEAARMPGAHL